MQAPAIQPGNPAPDKSVVLTRALIRAADHLGLSGRDLARIVGVSEATMSRLKRGDATLDAATKSFELAALTIRVFRSLDALMGGEAAPARDWLRNPNTALGGTPLACMTSIGGLVDVAAYLDARRAPI